MPSCAWMHAGPGRVSGVAEAAGGRGRRAGRRADHARESSIVIMISLFDASRYAIICHATRDNQAIYIVL